MKVLPWSRESLRSGGRSPRRPRGREGVSPAAAGPGEGGPSRLLRGDLGRFLLFLALVAAALAYLSARWDEYARETARRQAGAGDEAVLVGASAGEGGDFFAETRLERERARSAYRQQLRALAEGAAEPERAAAERQLVDLSWQALKEKEAEALVRARGYRDALVLLYREGAVVIVRAGILSDDERRTIAAAVAQVTGLGAERVRVWRHTG